MVVMIVGLLKLMEAHFDEKQDNIDSGVMVEVWIRLA
jgi:hypothetical protein